MTNEALSQRLKQAFERSQIDVDAIADRTKIPRSTIRSLLGEDVSALLPERVYLRGQVVIIAKEVGMDPDEARRMFDDEHPITSTRTEDLEAPRFSASTTVIAASLGGIALLAIVLAFAN